MQRDHVNYDRFYNREDFRNDDRRKTINPFYMRAPRKVAIFANRVALARYENLER